MNLTYFQLVFIRSAVSFYRKERERDELLETIEQIITEPYDPDEVSQVCETGFNFGPMSG